MAKLLKLVLCLSRGLSVLAQAYASMLMRLFFSSQAELKSLQEVASASFTYAQDLIKHNLVVFRSGEGALQTLPPLIDVLPEARLNLVIYHLKQGSYHWSQK